MRYIIPTYCLCALLVLNAYNAPSQKLIQANNYYEVLEGNYEAQSLNRMFLKKELQQVGKNRKYLAQENLGFIKIEETPIVLFESQCPRGNCNPTGWLQETAIVQVDTIFYNRIYLEKGKSYTFNVWYAIKVLGQTYYTDYKIHDFIAYERKMEVFDQSLILVAQSDGYEEFYDNSYPAKFFVVVLDASGDIMYESDIKDFTYGDEFYEPGDVVKSSFSQGKYGVTVFGLTEDLEFSWDGKRMSFK